MLKAAIVLIHDKSWRAELADGDVVFHDARGSSRTGQAMAGIHALVGDAGQVGRASLIPQADGDLGLTVLVAHAEGLVVQHLAPLPLRTDGVEAGVLAGAANAGLGGGALLVIATGWDVERGAAELALGIDHQLLPAHAGGLVVGSGALLVRSGADVPEAGIPADAAVAEQGLGAVGVSGALLPAGGRRLRTRRSRALFVRLALDVGPAHEALGALAAGHVEDDGAEGVGAAGRAHGAGVATDAANTSLVNGAIAVVLAASNYWVGCMRNSSGAYVVETEES